MYWSVPGSSNVIVVRIVSSARNRHLVRHRAVRLVGPGPMLLVERLVADQPLVVDRVLVDEDERHRHAARDADRGEVEGRVVDRDRHRHRAAGGAPGGRRRREEQRGDRQAREPAHAPASGRPRAGLASRARGRSARRRPARRPARGRGRSATAGPESAGTARSPRRSATARPRRTRRWRGRSSAASAAESMTTFVSHASFGTHSMPASERRSARRPSLAASLWSRIRPADSPKAPAFGQQRGPLIGQQVDVGLDGLGRGLAERQDPQRNPRVVGRDREVDRAFRRRPPGRARRPHRHRRRRP